MHVTHEGFETFRRGTFGNAGANLFVDASGTVRRIADQDLNGNGCYDIIMPNSHGYNERGPTTIFTKKDGAYEGHDLPHDSCWKAVVADVDNDGYEDLIIANGENGVSSILTSYVYYGGPDGLTGEVTEFHTEGAYDAAAVDLTGNGLKDIIFTSAWYDHHYPGRDFNQKVFVQEKPHEFREATEEFGLLCNTVMSLRAADLDGNGYDDLIFAGYKHKEDPNGTLYIFRNGPDGIERTPETFPIELITNLRTADVFGTGYTDIVCAGGGCIYIFRNRGGKFSAGDVVKVEYPGAKTQFFAGRLGCDIADIDGDGINELLVGTTCGLDIRKVTDLSKPWQKIDGFACSGVKAADLRHTGKMDIAAVCYATVKSYDTDSFIFENTGDDVYSFGHVQRIPCHGPVNVEIADLDHDGEAELIVCNTMGGPNQNDPEFPVFCYYGTPDLIYHEENRVDYPVNCGAYSYASGDVDNDGYPELVVTGWDDFRVFKGTENGPDPKNYYAVHDRYGRMPGGVILADFNHDGWLDVLMTCRSNRETCEDAAVLYFGGPDGFSEDRCQFLPVRIGCAQSVVCVDLDGDGYLDLACCDQEGYVSILYGCEEGFDLPRGVRRVEMKNRNGAEIIGLTAADINKDGKYELISTGAGHYTRKKSYMNILYDPDAGFPVEKQISVDVGGTTGYVSFADLRHTGSLDLILPFYSTTETRELPMRIFFNDGKGNYDFEHPLSIPCMSSIASMPIDLSRNGYPDLLVCCHRTDIGHIVQSYLFMNGPDGLDLEHPQKLWGYGPHDYTRNIIYNAMDRTESEYYTSPAIALDDVPEKIAWEAEEPNGTKLRMRVRFAEDEQSLAKAPWSEPVENGADPAAPEGTAFLQYQAEFFAPCACGSPKLTKVEIL
ncbi:MAG: VCBS repeat-containing protein [Lachnospiraceae bacterium]|nr:VCBS repeat-containing protein [Lachnospiraceae bacterium]